MKSSAKMRLPMAVIVAMNAMIGASIFTVPAKLSLSVGPAVFLSYVLVTVLVLCMASALAKITTCIPSTSPFYDYAFAWGGRIAGSIATLLYIVGLTVAMGLLAHVAGRYMVRYLPWLGFSGGGLLSIWPFVGLNAVGVALAQVGQYVLLALTLLPMVLIAILSVKKGSMTNLRPFMPGGMKSVLLASQVIIFSFFGFEAIPSLSSEVDDPQKTVPRAIIVSTVMTGLIYTLFVMSILWGISRSVFVSPDMPLSQALGTLYPRMPWLGWFIDWAIIVTIWGTMHSMVWAVANLVRFFLKTSLRVALVLVGIGVSASFLFFTSLSMMFAFTALCITLSYGMCIGALFACAQRTWRTKLLGGIALAAAAFVCVCAVIELVTIFTAG